MRVRGQPRRASPTTAVALLVLLVRTIYTITSFVSMTTVPETRGSTKERHPSVYVMMTSSDNEKLSVSMSSWLPEADDFFVFSSTRDTVVSKQKHVYFKFRDDYAWFNIRSQLVFMNLFLPFNSDWVVLAHDDSLVLLDELRRDLAAFDPDESYYSVIGTYNFEQPRSPPKRQLVVLSRGAIRTMLRRTERGIDGCRVSGSLDECLNGVSRLHMERDSHRRYRYQIVNRHFDSHEMKTYSKQHHRAYDDGFQIINQLSPRLFCFFGLSVDDLRIYSLLLNRVTLFTQ